MAKTPAEKKTAAQQAATQAPGASAGDTTKPAAPVAGAEAVAGTAPMATGEAAAEGAPAASTDPVTETAPATTGKQLDAEPGTGGTVTADPDSEIKGGEAVRISGWVIECKRRDRGLWRAGRFWPPEPTAVPADELTDDQLQALLAEPLLSVLAIE
ncbi:hypothetical protein METUNv1_01757 [Methyloversatilis universalis FAM5]|uniref:Mu-like prophage FluMu N-terminal domain-containing protein n=1 Tax=Methyloversatilis universalis (strain ATCC BAA-1314 / DSM 25237 / JCM 13912 / CCUG 52030 / FAM5) TaxID=1000565 RepID=F5RBW2_METUF|nr:hypothetical protein [Methyloversatilis universalis]EGK71979.1 hypothetical protein METUNv1_01757 [Methyloversatilis universalis FAM5]